MTARKYKATVTGTRRKARATGPRGRTSTKQSRHTSRRRPGQKPPGKARAGSATAIAAADLRSKAAGGGSMAEVAAALGVTPEHLASRIGSDKKLAAAWERGRLLYAVGPASYGASLEETARAMGKTDSRSSERRNFMKILFVTGMGK